MPSLTIWDVDNSDLHPVCDDGMCTVVPVPFLYSLLSVSHLNASANV